MSEREKKCLAVLAERYSNDEPRYPYMKTIAKETGLTVVQVKRSVRSLARKGFAEYVRGLFDEDGMVAGSAYGATLKGALVYRACVDCKKRIADMTDGRCSICWNDRPCSNCGKRYGSHELKNGHMEEFVFDETPAKTPSKKSPQS